MVFDLGETLLNFGKVETMRSFGKAQRLTYDYLMSHGQPAGSFWWYFIRNHGCHPGEDFVGQYYGQGF